MVDIYIIRKLLKNWIRLDEWILLAEPHLVKNWLLRQEVPDEAEQNMLSICWLFQLGFQKLSTADGMGVRF